MLIIKGRARQVFAVIADLACRHPKLTIKDYYWLAFANGGR